MDKVLQAAAEDGRFDVMLFVYNFLQQEQGQRVLKACKENNVGATLMKTNPVLNYFEMKENAEKAEVFKKFTSQA
jgi:RNase P/RNase MRP subunit p30